MTDVRLRCQLTQRPTKSTIGELISSLDAYYTRPGLTNLSEQLVKKRPILRPAMKLISVLGKFRSGQTLMFCFCVLFYPKKWFAKVSSDFYVVSLTANNERALMRCLSAMEKHTQHNASINIERVSTGVRLRYCFDREYRREALSALSRTGEEDPFLQINRMMGISVLPIFLDDLLRSNAKVVIVANDHSPASVALTTAAQQLKLLTCYVQHGPVTKEFPPLKFNLALLHNEFSRDCYMSSGPIGDTQIEIFPPIQTPFQQIRPMPDRLKICIAMSFFPNLAELQTLVETLQSFDHVDSITLKKHPRCKLDHEKIARELGVTFWREDKLTDTFVRSVDLCIVSNSGVTTEFLHGGCPTVFWEHGDTSTKDYYGYLKMGIIPEFDIFMIKEPTILDNFFDDEWLVRYSRIDPLVKGKSEAYYKEAMKWFVNQGLDMQ